MMRQTGNIRMEYKEDLVDGNEGEEVDAVDDAESMPIDVCRGINSISSSGSCGCLIIDDTFSKTFDGCC